MVGQERQTSLIGAQRSDPRPGPRFSDRSAHAGPLSPFYWTAFEHGPMEYRDSLFFLFAQTLTAMLPLRTLFSLSKLSPNAKLPLSMRLARSWVQIFFSKPGMIFTRRPDITSSHQRLSCLPRSELCAISARPETVLRSASQPSQRW